MPELNKSSSIIKVALYFFSITFLARVNRRLMGKLIVLYQ